MIQINASRLRLCLAAATFVAVASLGALICVLNARAVRVEPSPPSTATSSVIAPIVPEPRAAVELPREPAIASTPENATTAETSPPPKQEDALFSSLPHATRSDFERKYKGWDVDRLTLATNKMRDAINDAVNELMDQRFSKGLFDEIADARRPDASDPNKGEVMPAGTAPEGLGRVWPCSKYEQSNGTTAAKTTYITEAEYPQLFANLDEQRYVLHLWNEATKAKQKQ